ncbi:hypothetical protein PSTG_09395 [Puccinia striiformis f. sp. tritici PST-78]|uniref:DDE Tnp4 domain-containing protein n=1 Tax=Puccinia striiformis f. sp. tritici PST-78 TaxID=1165861 RepID=A0A0L0VE59_9BASI|nr:hypothetical protein PSTG_09395 [Puccinia striiformis f. sp. tritici PST-78]
MAILRFQNQLVTWPSRGARQTLQKYHADSGFEGCVGLIDGTLIPLHKCPQKDGSDYYSRKGFYVIAALVVCDHKKNITYVYTGWPGCSHDQALTRNSILTTNPEGFFSDSEYLLADSAFTPTVNMVPAYKRLWKGQFQSLKGLRLRVLGKKDLACAVLHSFLNQTKDSEINELESDSDYQELDINELESDSDSHDQELEQEASSTAESIRPSLAGTKKQTEVMNNVLEFLKD